MSFQLMGSQYVVLQRETTTELHSKGENIKRVVITNRSENTPQD